MTEATTTLTRAGTPAWRVLPPDPDASGAVGSLQSRERASNRTVHRQLLADPKPDTGDRRVMADCRRRALLMQPPRTLNFNFS